MQDLRFLKTDGDFIVLESSNGDSFRLVLDDVLRKAIRNEPKPETKNVSITPREIQLEIRAGVTPEELAAKTSAPLEFIEKFAAPVIAELEHVVQSALSVRITIASDRYSDSVQAEFGEVIANRLAKNGVVSPAWSSKRVENGGWQVICTVEDGKAIWAFDPKKLALSPENELAVQLSTQQSLTDGPITKLRSVFSETPQKSVNSTLPAAFASSQSKAVEPEATPDEPENIPVQNLTKDLGSTQEFQGVVAFGRSAKTEPTETKAEPAVSGQADELENTADLLDALRKKRAEREESALEEPKKPETSSITEMDAVFEFVDEPAPEPENQDSDPELTPEDTVTRPIDIAKPTPKKGRAAVPSWDDIVFGTKHEE